MIKIVGFVIEGLLILSFLVLAYSQLVRPLLTKTPVFPFFRRRPKTEREIEAVNEALQQQSLERELKTAKRKLRK